MRQQQAFHMVSTPPSRELVIKQQGPTALKSLLVCLSALVLVVSGVGYFVLGHSLSEIDPPVDPTPDGAVDFLLVGSDSRTDAQGNPLTPEEIDMLHAGDEEADNTDTIMVIRVPNDGSSATAVSIPRDTYVYDPEVGNLKINGVYSHHKAIKTSELITGEETDQQVIELAGKEAGRQGLMRSVADLTGISVDHYVEIGLVGFVLLTDAVGGVEVCLNADTFDEYSGADFKAGAQTLNGAQGLAFVRQRHGLTNGDFDRIVRQQAFMASLVSKVLSTDTLTSHSKLASLSDAVSRSIVADRNLDIMQFAAQMQNLTGGNVQFNTIPVTSKDGTGDNGESVVTVDVDEVHKFFNQLLGGTDSTASKSPTSTVAAPTAEVITLNASTTTNLAARVAGFLQTEGYTISETSSAMDGLYNQSQVLASDITNPEAIAIAEKLGGLPINVSTTLDSRTIAVVTADDYGGPEGETLHAGSTQTVGQVGTLEEENAAPVIDAGGNSPRCVN